MIWALPPIYLYRFLFQLCGGRALASSPPTAQAYALRAFHSIPNAGLLH
ncbi:MAG: hypothetical protein JWM14_2644 [Chitinophagaceae bacterium]|nr:hypothetical protein [Chitinophagaceae bacterium]